MQVWWFVKERNLAPEFEELVQALWEQRLNALADKIDSQAGNTTFNTVFEPMTEDEDDKGRAIMNLKLNQVPSVIQTVSTCYLAIYILRLPVFIGDLVLWIRNKWLPYIGAIDMLPLEMRKRLVPSSIEAIRDNQTMTAERLQARTNQLFMAYQQELGLQIPALNLPLCLYRIIESLSLPIDVYPAVRKLAALQKYSFTYPGKAEKGWNRLTPDKQLAAYVVVAVKLMYPFDTVIKYPVTNTEPASAIVDWAIWSRAKKRHDESINKCDLFTDEEARTTTENDVIYMSETSVDQYMDWFTEAWAKPGEAHALAGKTLFVQQMFDFFPIGNQAAKSVKVNAEEMRQSITEGIRAVNNDLILRPAREYDSSEVSKLQLGRPADQYPRYRRVEEMDDIAKEVYNAIANFVGFTTETLVQLTLQLELRLAEEDWNRPSRNAYAEQTTEAGSMNDSFGEDDETE